MVGFCGHIDKKDRARYVQGEQWNILKMCDEKDTTRLEIEGELHYPDDHEIHIFDCDLEHLQKCLGLIKDIDRDKKGVFRITRAGKKALLSDRAKEWLD